MHESNAQQVTSPATLKAELVAMFTEQVNDNSQHSDRIAYRTGLGHIFREFSEYEAAGDIQTGDLPRDVAEKIYSMKNNIKGILALHAAGKTQAAVECYRQALMNRVADVALTALPDDLAKTIRNILGRSLKSGFNPITVH